ncbi:VanZ family protein [Macromonas nakdongensis]|uniref:VanZ family protein n=1 Tax=Macromonas nakdongensis TaxID=1843082 RepID=UPI0034E19E90
MSAFAVRRPRPSEPVGADGRRLSLAWPVALAYAVLVVYASLFPFTGWRLQGIAPWSFLLAPWPQYWTGFDIAANLLGYVPLGLLLTLAVARTGRGRGAWLLGTLGPVCLSLALESVQSYLTQRVPSQVDWGLNSLGAALGAVLALLLLRWRVLGPWVQFRQACFVPDTRGALVLLLTWPLAVLYPTSVPFGLGQAWQRLEVALVQLTEGSALQGWLPQAAPSLPLSPLAEALVVALCVWAPVLLGYAVLRRPGQRFVFALLFGVVLLSAGVLSASLTFGPVHAWAWLTPPASLGLVVAAAMSLFGLALGHRTAAVLSLLAWSFALGLLNRAPETAYFAQSLETWEQGRFIRFHGLSQWLGWLWPYAALWVGVRLALRPRGAHYNATP